MLYHNNCAAIEVFTTSCVLSGIKVAWKKCEENFGYEKQPR